jgi:uncharacterized protein YqgC (DUF456 family)
MSELTSQLSWLPLAILVICSLVAIISVVLTGSGTYFILIGAAVHAWLTGFAEISAGTLMWLAGLFVLGEVLEYLVTMAVVKRFGGSKQAALGAAIGGFAGAVLGIGLLGVGMLPGTLLGLFAGGFAGEWVATKDRRRSTRAGVAGLASRIAVILMKLAIAATMLVVTAVSIAANDAPPASIPDPAGPAKAS